MTLANGPYLYRVNGIGRPIVVEIYAGHVCEAGEDHIRPLSMYTIANFRRLIEAKTDEEFAAELDAYCDAKEANANDQPS